MDTSASAVLTAVVARLIPGNAVSPGAVEAGVPAFVAAALTGAYAHEAETVSAGLGALDAAALEEYGVAFASLEADVQDAMLTTVETESFFDVLLQLTIDGFLCDPIHGGNRDLVGWRLIGYPGIVMAPTEEDQQIGRPMASTGTTLAEWERDR